MVWQIVILIISVVNADQCFGNRYPLTIGQSSYDTEITHIKEFSSANQVLVGGYSYIYRNKKDAFLMVLTLAPSTNPVISVRSYYFWEQNTFTIEQYTYDSGSSVVLAVFGVGNSYYIAQINPTTLKMEKIKKIDQSVDNNFDLKTSWGSGPNFGPFLIRGLNEMYMAINNPSGSLFGFVKFDDFEAGTSSIFRFIDCSKVSGAKCFSDQLIIGDSSSILNVGSVLDDGKTFTSFSLFSSDGTWQWDYILKQSDSILANYYSTKAIDYQTDRYVAIMEHSDQSQANNILLLILIQSGTSQISNHFVFEIGDGASAYQIMKVDFRDASNLYMGVKDITNSQDKLMIVGKLTQTYQILDLSYSVSDVHWLDPSSDNLGAFVVGKASQYTDGTLTQTFTNNMGFVIPLVMNNVDTCCHTHTSHAWGAAIPYSAGSLSSDLTPTCMVEQVTQNGVVTVTTAWSQGQQVTMNVPGILMEQKEKEVIVNGETTIVQYTVYYQQIAFSFSGSTLWCMKQAQNSLSPTWNHGVPAELTYTVTDAAQNHPITHFSMNFDCADLIKTYTVQVQNTDSSGNTLDLSAYQLAKIVIVDNLPKLQIYRGSGNTLCTETTTNPSIFAGGLHTVIVTGKISNSAAVYFTTLPQTTSFTVRLRVKKECKTAYPVVVGGIPNTVTHYPPRMIVGQYDGQTSAQILESTKRLVKQFTPSDSACKVIYELSYLDASDNRVIVPTSSDPSYILYHPDQSSNEFILNYDKPIENSDAGDHIFQLRAYIDLSDSVSSTDPAVTPNELIQVENMNISVNCARETLTPSSLNSQYEYTFGAPQALLFQITEFTKTYPICYVQYRVQYRKSDMTWWTNSAPAKENVDNFENTDFLPWLMYYKNSTREIRINRGDTNKYSSTNPLNSYFFRIKAEMQGDVVAYSNVFQVDIHKDCQYATLTSQAISHQSITYIASDVKQIVTFTLPTRSDIYCAVDYLIEVQKLQQGAWQDYQTAFSNDLITKITTPLTGTHQIEIKSTVSDYTKLNDHVGTHNVRFVAKIGDAETIQGGSRASVTEQFTLEVKSMCNNLQIVPSQIQDQEFEVYQASKTASLPKFGILWPWVSPTAILSSSSLVTEAQVRALCGNWQYTAVDRDTNQAIDASMTFSYTQTSLSLQFQSNDPLKSYTSSSLPWQKVYPIKISATLQNSPFITGSQNFDAYVRYHCWKKETLQITVDDQDFDNHKYPKESYIINQNGLMIKKDMGELNWNKSCADTLRMSLDIQVLKKDNQDTPKVDSFLVLRPDQNQLIVNPISLNAYAQKVWVKYYANLMKGSDDLNDLYPNFPHYYGHFELDVLNCKIINITKPEISNYTYQIGETYKLNGILGPYNITNKCEYEQIYESFILNGEKFQGNNIEPLPDFIEFRNRSGTLIDWKIQTDDISLNNTEYWIITRLKIVDELSNKFAYNTTDYSLIWTLKLIYMPNFPENKPPYIQDGVVPKNIVLIKINQTFELSIDQSKISEDTVDLKVEFDDKYKSFITSAVKTNPFSIKIKISPRSRKELGGGTISIILIDKIKEDEKGLDSMKSTYMLNFNVYEPVKEIQVQKQDESKKKEKEYVLAKIDRIDTNGLAHVKFSEALYNSEVYGRQSTQEFLKRVKVSVIPGSFQNASKLNFEYDLVKLDPKSMQVQINFTDAIHISTGETPDILNITFLKIDMFKKKDDRTITIKQFESIYKTIPAQMPNSGRTKVFEQMAGAASIGSNAFIYSQIIMNVVLSASMQPLWGMINALQIVMHLRATEIQFPSNAVMIFSQVKQITECQVLDEDMIEVFYVWQYFETQPQEQKQRRLEETKGVVSAGYENIDMVQNLETLFVIIFISVSLIFVVIPIVYCLQKRIKWFKKVLKKLQKMFFWNGIIRFIMEGYMELSINAFINLNQLLLIGFNLDITEVWTQNLVSTVLTISLLTIMIFLPIISCLFMKKNQVTLQNYKEFDQKLYQEYDEVYGSFFEGLHLWRPASVFYSSVFMIRRLIMAAAIIFQVYNPGMQVIIILQLNVLIIIFIGYGRPHESRKQNVIELVNEVLTLTASYHLIPFSDAVGDVETKYSMGYSLIGNVGIIMLFNLCNIIMVFKHSIFSSYERRQMRKRWLKDIKKLQEIKQKFQDNQKRGLESQLEYHRDLLSFRNKHHQSLIKRYIRAGMTKEEVEELNDFVLKQVEDKTAFIAEANRPNRFAAKLSAQLVREEEEKKIRDEINKERKINLKYKKRNVSSVIAPIAENGEKDKTISDGEPVKLLIKIDDQIQESEADEKKQAFTPNFKLQDQKQQDLLSQSNDQVQKAPKRLVSKQTSKPLVSIKEFLAEQNIKK